MKRHHIFNGLVLETEQGSWCLYDDHLAEIAAAVAKEREACAALAQHNHPDDGDCCYADAARHGGHVAQCESIAAAIRARGEK